VTTRILATWLCAAVGFAPGSTATAAPQTFNTALPVAQSQFVLREQFIYRKTTGDPRPTDRELRLRGGVSVLGFGITGNHALFGVLPWLDKELDAGTPGGRALRSTSGFADARLFGRYTLYKNDAPGRTFRIAPFLGIEFPTGDDNDSDDLGPLPAPLQLGSGSWDPFGGIILTYQTLRYQIDAQASYTRNTQANNFEFGDESRLDASLQYRLWPQDLEAGVPGFLYAVLESNFLYADRNTMNGVKDADSGGASFFLSPGLQYVTRRWIIEGIVQLPVSHNLNGAALEDDLIVRVGFRVNF